MTGHQPHPGTGHTAMGQDVTPVSIERVLWAIGLTTVETVDPLDHAHAVEVDVAAEPGVKAIIFCVMPPSRRRSYVDAQSCIGCKRCVSQLGCPALVPQEDGKVAIDASQCTGCTLCEQICPTHAISGGERL